MRSIECAHSQAEGSRELLALDLMPEGTLQDDLQAFRVQENQGSSQPLLLPQTWKQSIPLFSGELALFLPVGLGGLDWSSRERILSGCLVESLVSGFAIHLRVSLTEEEGEAFMGALGVNRVEEQCHGSNFLSPCFFFFLTLLICLPPLSLLISFHTF